MHAKEAFANMLGSEHQTPKHTILLVTQWLQHFKDQTNHICQLPNVNVHAYPYANIFKKQLRSEVERGLAQIGVFGCSGCMCHTAPFPCCEREERGKTGNQENAC